VLAGVTSLIQDPAGYLAVSAMAQSYPAPILSIMRLTVVVALLVSLSASLQPVVAQKAVGVARDSHGRIARSEKAKAAFKKQTGYPHGRPGYVIDHIVPLSRGGSDSPTNMQWQTKAEAKAKDHWERGGSSHTSTYRSRSYSRKSYAPKYRAPRTSRAYSAPRARSYSHYRSTRSCCSSGRSIRR
jgi:hypothetical protein